MLAFPIQLQVPKIKENYQGKSMENPKITGLPLSVCPILARTPRKCSPRAGSMLLASASEAPSVPSRTQLPMLSYLQPTKASEARSHSRRFATSRPSMRSSSAVVGLDSCPLLSREASCGTSLMAHFLVRYCTKSSAGVVPQECQDKKSGGIWEQPIRPCFGIVTLRTTSYLQWSACRTLHSVCGMLVAMSRTL